MFNLKITFRKLLYYLLGEKMHILLSKAKKYHENKNGLRPEGFRYDDKIGYWMSNTDGSPYVLDQNFCSPASKKHDIETGEDQKGE